MNNRLLWTASIVVVMLVVLSAAPIQAAITFGRWRDINPTQYTSDPKGSLRGIYVRNGGSGSIGAGDGWAVGGDNISNSQQPILAHYDGFSWPIIASPIVNATYNSVNFCTNPGAPGVGLCSPNGDGSDGWIVGNSNSTMKPSGSGGGIALYWDGAALTVQDTGLSDAKNLTSVFMVCHSPAFSTGCPSGAAFVSGLTYAVGTNGTNQGSIWAFSGDPKTSGGWIEQKVVGTATTRYNSVYMFQDGAGNLEGFAVGEGGVVARLFSGGNTWTATPIGGAANTLLGVFVDQTNPIDAWAVGRGGQVWHFSTGIWAGPVTPAGTARDLYSVQLVSTSEGWIVGSNGTILHSTTLGQSNSWLTLTTPLQTAVGDGIGLFSASFPGGGNGWADGAQGVILQTGNSGCGSAVPQPCWGGSTNILNSAQLNAVWELGSSDAWAGGLFNASSQCCSLIHWDGIKWHRANVAPSQTINPDIWTIYMLSSSEGWALGGNATHTGPEALLWNGQSWNGQPIAGCGVGTLCEPRSVFMLSGGTGGDGWAVGLSGEIWRHQSGSWTLFSQPTTNNLNGVFINNQGAPAGTPAGWAVGNSGTVLALTITGGIPVWTPHAIPQAGSSNLNGVYFIDSMHGWIVGSSSTIVQTTDGGNTWSGGSGQVTGCCGSVSSTANLTSVFVDTFGTGSGNGDGWAVGDDQNTPGNAVFAHWDGVTWVYTPLTPPILAGSVTPGMSLRSVYLTNPEDGWAVGRPVTGGSLSSIIHLDPTNPPVVGQQATNTNSTSSSSTAGATTSTESSTSTSSSANTESVTTSSVTSTATTESTVTVTSTPMTTTLSTSSVSTPLIMPAVPGFPWESIIAGVIVGMVALTIVRRRRN